MLKPILFNTDMVKAILAGKKTVTRRPIKGMGNTWHINKLLCDWGLSREPKIIDGILHWEIQTDVDDSNIFKYKLPCHIRDILWVRETWKIYKKAVNKSKNYKIAEFYGYKADENNKNNPSEFYEGKWRPSIHMPRKAARIFLKVNDVRVERLQDITEDNAEKEGFKHGGIKEPWITANGGFMTTWNKIYGNWNDNPWVWVIEFERIDGYVE